MENWDNMIGKYLVSDAYYRANRLLKITIFTALVWSVLTTIFVLVTQMGDMPPEAMSNMGMVIIFGLVGLVIGLVPTFFMINGILKAKWETFILIMYVISSLSVIYNLYNIFNGNIPFAYTPLMKGMQIISYMLTIVGLYGAIQAYRFRDEKVLADDMDFYVDEEEMDEEDSFMN
ncbi:hypothetical protein [Atopobacter phocae]|uniref:hypothetical protein n=1 Tax=Atopobacter phocae TaxID=136492 RepID=UPI00046F04D9|nr:hypothetical protein [Atopobacter phocae]